MKFGELYAPGMPGRIDEARLTITDTNERLSLCAYLAAGQVVLRSLQSEPDVLEPDNEVRLEVAYLSDGEFIWPLSLSYYVLMHGLAPDDEFYEHIRSRNYEIAPLQNTDLLSQAAKLLSTRWTAAT